ncbi:PhzF family phenazine biosynthesis protein [Streptomyces sp. WMMC897]|uniref:PhzF family phenazine biosynthesis protein n=1 Tax=Streptomyces sp. WMMC897 TaxID=3014782 RepID=UPI0022B66256|nr:PhzF family phenazine biosynthesis protein [Streptomyces sp. WMMC897]MCZ7415178.1 PhzF family phenazine biosynthesis protein [Streptomyces sp. WMMC897]
MSAPPEPPEPPEPLQPPAAPSVTLVHACLRDGAGGSPTAVVVDEEEWPDGARRRVPADSGASHAVFLRVRHEASREPTVDLRFFTAEGELPACGHGTVAALAFLADRAGSGGRLRATVRTAQRVFEGWSVRDGDHATAAFDPGPVDLREPTDDERELARSALGVPSGWPGRDTAPQASREPGRGMRVAGVGRERLLVPVPSRTALAALRPDLGRLREGCDRLGLLGAYVHSPPSGAGRLAARMFAPSIGVPEDIANANSTACLAAHLAGRGVTEIAVDMGDALGSPATITASAVPGRPGARVRLGASVRIGETSPSAG